MKLQTETDRIKAYILYAIYGIKSNDALKFNFLSMTNTLNL